MDVLLIRHAEAGERDRKRWPDDDLRPISAEGRVKQIACARGMVKAGMTIDRLITSPLLRAVETAAIIAEIYGLPAEVPTSDALGHGCTPEAVVELLKAQPGSARCIGLVGHEPDFSKVAAALIGAPHARLELKKSGVIEISFESAMPAVGKATLRGLVRPKVLRKK